MMSNIYYQFGVKMEELTKVQIIALVAKTYTHVHWAPSNSFAHATFPTTMREGTILVRGDGKTKRWVLGMMVGNALNAAALLNLSKCLTAVKKIKNLRSIAFSMDEHWDDCHDYHSQLLNFANSAKDVNVHLVSQHFLPMYTTPDEIFKDPEAWSQHAIWINETLNGGMYKGVEEQIPEEEEQVPEPEGEEQIQKPDEEEQIVPTYETTTLLTYTIENIPEGYEDFFSWEMDPTYDGSLIKISKELKTDAEKGVVIYPPIHLIYNAFHHVKPENLKVLIIGMDPYIHERQAMGLSFSVEKDVAVPPSLRNIKKELIDDGWKDENPECGDLSQWCQRGVFLYNSALTVKDSDSSSYLKLWKSFSSNLVTWLHTNCHPLVIIAWGTPAQIFAKQFNQNRNKIITSSHPSPLSAHVNFFGSKPFSKANYNLKLLGREPVDWNLYKQK
jgi:uracil-DNA glycosylase